MNDHEQRRVLFGGNRTQPGGDIGGDRERGDTAAHRLPGGTRAVERHRQDVRQVCQGRLPEFDLPRRHRGGVALVAENSVLPQREVRVLDGEWLPRRSRTGGSGAVGDHHVSGQRCNRRTVRGNVVDDDGEHVALRAGPVQHRAEGKIDRDVESCCCSITDERIDRTGVDVYHAEGQLRSGDVLDRCNDLVRKITHGREHRAERLVPGQNVADGSSHRTDVQATGQVHGERDVVRGRGHIELVDEPHPLLRERQRDRIGPIDGDECRTAMQRRALGFGAFGQSSDRRRLEQIQHLQVGAESRIDPRDQTRCHEGVSAEIEEAVGDADTIDLQHVTEHGRHCGLVFRFRGCECTLRTEFGFWECVSVEFACRSQRNRLQHHERRRHHMRRQHRTGMLTQHIRRDLGTGHRQHIRHQHRCPGSRLASDGDHEIDTRHCRQHRIDLTQLDPETTHLHLKIATPHILQRTRRIPPHHITGAIHPRTRTTERIGHEPLRRQTQPRVIPTSQRRTRQIQLTHHTHRHRIQPRIQHHLREADRRRTDIDRLPHHQRRGNRRENRRLRRTVRIEHPPTRRPPRHQLRRTHITTGHHHLDRIQPHRIHRRQCRRRDERMRDPLGGQQRRQLHPTEHQRRRNHHRRPTRERQHELENRGIETRRRKRQHPRRRPHTEPNPLLGSQVPHTTMSDHHTLGHTRRTRRVNQIRRIIEPQHTRTLGIQHRSRRPKRQIRHHIGIIEHHPRNPTHTRQHTHIGTQRHTHHSTRIDQHVLDPIHRIIRIHRQERTTGLRHRPHRHDRLHRPRQRQRHERPRTHPTRHQHPRQPRRRRIQLTIRNRPRPRHHRNTTDTSNTHSTSQQLRQHHTHHRPRTTNRSQASALGGGQQVHIADQQIRFAGESVEHAYEATGELSHARGIEQFCGVVENDRESVGLVDGDDQIHADPGTRQCGRTEPERYLSKRAVRFRARQTEGRDDVFERRVTVRHRSIEVGSGCIDELGERVPNVGSGPEHHGVAVTRRHGDRHVVGVRESRKQRGESGFEDHERSRGTFGRQSSHLGPRLGSDGHFVGCANVTDARGARSVGRKIEEIGGIGEPIGPVGELGCGATPALAFARAVRMYVDNGDIGSGRDEGFHHVDEARVVCGEIVVVVPVGVGPEIDVRPGRRTALINVDQKVFDGARSHDVELADDRTEVDLLMEQHHVDHRAGKLLVATRSRQLAPNVLDAEALVAQGSHQFELHLLHQLAYGRVLGHVDRNGCDVDEHSTGSAKQCGGARGHRDVDRDILAPGHAREVAAEGGDEHRCCGSPLGRVGRLELGDDILGQSHAAEFAGGDRTTGSVGQGSSVVDVRGTSRPVLLVGLEAGRRPVFLIELVESAELGRLVGGRLDVFDGRCVQGCGSIDESHGTVAVECDVVDLAVPEVALVLDLNDPTLDERIVLHVDRLNVVLVDPLQGRRHCVVFTAQIQIVHRLVDRVVDDLNGFAVDLCQPEVGRLELVSGLRRRFLQHGYVEAASQIHVLGDADRNIRRELLSEPHASLSGRQRKAVLEAWTGRGCLRSTGSCCAHSLALRRHGHGDEGRRRVVRLGALGSVRSVEPRRPVRAIEQFWLPFGSAFVSIHARSVVIWLCINSSRTADRIETGREPGSTESNEP